MAEDEQKKRDRAIEEELRGQQKFTMAGAIGRSGGGMLKGASPVPRLVQAVREITDFIQLHVSDPSGALKSILKARIAADEVRVGQHLDRPLVALREIVEHLLSSDPLLFEFVRRVDVKWGQMFQERPHFQQPGQEPHPDDEYTHASVRKDLQMLLEKVREAGY